MRAPVYVLSTGRCGSTLVSGLLSPSGARAGVAHQLPGSRMVNVLGNLAAAGRIPAERAERLSARLGGFDPRRSTADPLRSVLLATAVREGRAPADARVVHLVRDPRDFVTSFMRWKRASAKRTVLHHLVPAWQPNPWLVGESGLARWTAMSKFEHFAWVWRWKNHLFESLRERTPYLRVRLEDLTDGNGSGEVMRRLAEFAGAGAVPPAVVAGRPAAVNASRGRFPRWPSWTPRQARMLDGLCGGLMRDLGYGDEPAWLALVSAAPAERAAAERPE